MVLTVLFLILTLLTAVFLIMLLIMSVYSIVTHLLKKPNQKQVKHLKRVAVCLGVSILCNGLLIPVSQFTAHTPTIRDEQGNIPENAVSELIKVELNGRKQWISIRGHDKDNPVLLFLAGGPGGTQMAAVRHELSRLEKHFVVVNWDQPGSGKSYGVKNEGKISVDTYIDDGIALTEYLISRFSKEQIYLIGESWGSALGIFLINKKPDYYHAFIGTGQMVDFEETERLDYAKALEIAEQKGDKSLINRLRRNGVPPYYGDDVTWKSAVYLNYLSAYMANLPEIHNPGYNTLRDIFSPEYGISDKINYIRGVVYTFNEVYQQLYDIDLRKDYTSLNVPVYFFLGRYDYNAPTSLVEEYYELLDAPQKEILWFEHSAHSPWINESDKFINEVLSRFLGE
ncbi:MAG: alpha/beta hydrolase [Clostridiales bacterium]|nr:alpha/beta hydrolase [Clostridiales bacterium]